jgi:hypothetical protein
MLLVLMYRNITSLGHPPQGRWPFSLNSNVETSKVYEQLQGFGFTPEQIDIALVRGHSKKLVETGARRIPQPGQVIPQALRATNVGLYHINRLSHQFAYIDAIVVDTPLLDVNARECIKNVEYIDMRLDRAEVFRRYLDHQWGMLSNTRAKFAFDWSIATTNLRKDIEYIRSRN